MVDWVLVYPESGDGNGDPLYPLDINGDIRLTGAIVKADGTIYSSGGGVKGLYSVQDSNTGKYKFGVGNLIQYIHWIYLVV